MQAAVRLDHFGCDPRTFASRTADRRTAPNHLLKCGVCSNLKTRLTNPSCRTFRKMKVLRKQNRPWFRRPPQDRITFLIPREDPHSISAKKPRRRKVTSNCQQSFIIRKIGRGKENLFCQTQHNAPNPYRKSRTIRNVNIKNKFPISYVNSHRAAFIKSTKQQRVRQPVLNLRLYQPS